MEFDSEAEISHWQVVIGASYLIAALGSTQGKQLRREFEGSIDHCLARCEADGIETKQPFFSNLIARLGNGLH